MRSARLADTVILGACTVTIDDTARYLETRFPDGTVLPAAPNYDPASIALAHDLGYVGDTWAMSRDHELTHSWLAALDGLDWSPTLWHVAHRGAPGHVPMSGDAIRAEEARVLNAQRSLSKMAPRPWEQLCPQP